MGLSARVLHAGLGQALALDSSSRLSVPSQAPFAKVAKKNRAYDRGPDRVSGLGHMLSVLDEECFDWLAVLAEKPFSDFDEV